MNLLRRLFARTLSPLEEVEIIKVLAEQVVLAVEQTASLSGQDKKRLALALLTDLLRESGLDPPSELLLEIAIEAAVRLTRPAASRQSPRVN